MVLMAVLTKHSFVTGYLNNIETVTTNTLQSTDVHIGLLKKMFKLMDFNSSLIDLLEYFN